MYRIEVTPEWSLKLIGLTPKKSPLKSEFVRGVGHGLLQLDLETGLEAENSSVHFWQSFVREFLFELDAESEKSNLELNEKKASKYQHKIKQEFVDKFIKLNIYRKIEKDVDRKALLAVWDKLNYAIGEQLKKDYKSYKKFFSNRKELRPVLGRVCFHLTENKFSQSHPFAFLATYVQSLDEDGKPIFVPLAQAINNTSNVMRKHELSFMLAPLLRASKESKVLEKIMASKKIFHPLSWNTEDAAEFLDEVSIFEKANIIVSIPANWRRRVKGKAKLNIELGDHHEQGLLGVQALMDFSVFADVNGEKVTALDIEFIVNQNKDLVFFRGNWMEINPRDLSSILNKWQTFNHKYPSGKMNLREGLRLLSEFDEEDDNEERIRVISSESLQKTLAQLRSPQALEEELQEVDKYLHAVLRPYQKQGLSWLYLLHRLQLGGVLADDMGLGKTIQVIALLLAKKHCPRQETNSGLPLRSQLPTLLIVPASLLGNWKDELIRFAPSLKTWFAHRAFSGTQRPPDKALDLIVTTFTTSLSLEWLKEGEYSLIILDEAQAIKNPDIKQTRLIKALRSPHRLALTGTPVENRLTDLWSLFDFVSPGLLGSLNNFKSYTKMGGDKGPDAKRLETLRKIVRPYVLRREKSDKNVIADLPDKTEIKTYCQLSKLQIAMYQTAVATMAEEVEKASGLKRRGLILSYIIKFKQICNHPSQFLKSKGFSTKDSGKFIRLREICTHIAESKEKVLVFTQFKEMVEPLHNLLAEIFASEGLTLHGSTSVAKRSAAVETFQKSDNHPFFVLSLKAGGTGLNLTRASHVVHFDRWWNPAVENQATDRAFRIGQKRNVLVHKFICKGTIEDKVDILIDSKQQLAKGVLCSKDSPLLTEMSNTDLIQTVSLDLKALAGDEDL